MLRSLYSSISGLRNHQVSLDVTGNNIANVNTAGFKAGRVTFKESMAQLLQGASRPPGFQGGTNPIQMGLGMAVGSIDTMLIQGNLQSTGKITDMAIEGDAYFVYGTGEARYYSRMGAVQFDANGNMVNPANGFALQGKMATEAGTYEGQPIGDIRIPFGDKAPANATTEVAFSSNLDSDSEGLGTVTYSKRFLAQADTTTTTETLTSLYDASGNSLGIRIGDTITMSATIGAATYTRNITVVENAADVLVGQAYNPSNVATGAVRTYSDLITEMNNLVSNNGGIANTAIAEAGGSGAVTVSVAGAGTAITNLQVTSDRPGGSSGYISKAFAFPSTITVGSSENSGELRRPAEATDIISTLYDANGNAIAGSTGMEDGNIITVNGAVGGTAITSQQVTYTSGVTTLQEIVDAIRTGFGLPLQDGTTAQNSSVSVNAADTNSDNIPDGSIVIRGQPELTFSISNASIQSNDADTTNATLPTRFNGNMSFVELQSARNTTVHSTSIVVYDESGDAHTMTTTFTRTQTPGRWLWEITMEGGERVTGGDTGVITFAQDGSPSSFVFTADPNGNTATQFSFDPMNGSNEVRVNLDVGSPGSFRGITQFRSPSTTAAKSQDGYTMGKLQKISINEYGEISGIFTNGTNKSLAQIYIADFNNPGGLLKMGDSMYRPSSNTGDPVLGIPNVSSSSSIKPGALELSNVELATEFTNMITTQRGFQANARVITTSDSMLQELVQLVR